MSDHTFSISTLDKFDGFGQFSNGFDSFNDEFDGIIDEFVGLTDEVELS